MIAAGGEKDFMARDYLFFRKYRVVGRIGGGMLMLVAENHDAYGGPKAAYSKHTGTRGQHRRWEQLDPRCMCIHQLEIDVSEGRGTVSLSQYGFWVCRQAFHTGRFQRP